jgi:hypothetical protein
LLGEQFLDTAEHYCALFEEQANFAREEVGDGLGYDLQGQRVAHVHLDEAHTVLRSPDHLLLHEQLLAGDGIQPREAQRAHARARTLQQYKAGRFLPAGQQQATLVRRLAYPAQQSLEIFVAWAIVPPALSFLQQGSRLSSTSSARRSCKHSSRRLRRRSKLAGTSASGCRERGEHL